MSVFEQAADDIRRFAIRMQGVIALSAELDRIGSLDNAASEAEGRLSLAKQQEEEATVRLAAANKAIDDASAYAEKVTENAKLDVNDVYATANVAAKKTLADAKANADEIVAAGNTKLTAIEAEIASRSKALDDLSADIETAQATLDHITTAIAEAKAKIGA